MRASSVLFTLLLSSCLEVCASSTGVGFFRVERVASVGWRVRDPQGGIFIPLGIDHCRLHGEGMYGNRMLDKFGSADAWAIDAICKLKEWRFTLIGACGAEELYGKGLPYAIYTWMGESYSLEGGDKAILQGTRRPGTAFPNVFNPEWPRFCRKSAKAHFAPHRYDRNLFGWFFDNELAWWGDKIDDASKTGRYGLVDVVAALPSEHSARMAHDAFMSAHSGEWTREKCRAEFLREIAERYFGGIVPALREADPNHLVLGCRFSGVWMEPEILEVAGRWLDVVSFNHYPYVDIDTEDVYVSWRDGAASCSAEERYREMYALTKRPMFVTEWSFPSTDAGLPCRNGEGMRTRSQIERTKASGIFARMLMSLPFILGYDYFMWHDSAGGGEDCNYGLVSNDGVPYSEITKMFMRLHEEIMNERRGK